MARILLPFSHPAVDYSEEVEVLPLKCCLAMIDGYEISLNFSEAQHDNCTIESLQIQSAYTPFLPFNLVCKIARSFLGDHCLSFIGFTKANKKIYCWTVKILNQEAVPPNPAKSKLTSYEGFQYYVLEAGSVNLYES